MSLQKSDKILYILPVPNFFSQGAGIGGHVSHVYGIVASFAELGYELNIIADESHPAIESKRTKVFILPTRKTSILNRQFWGGRLIRLVQQVVKQSSYKFCYIRYSVGFTLWLPILKRVLADVPLVLEVNSIGAQSYTWLKYSDLWALRSADLIICVSETVRKLILTKVSRQFDSQIVVLPNGVDIEKFAACEPDYSFFQEKKSIKLGYTGTLKPEYGIDILLNAYSLIHQTRKDITLHIFGAGPYYQKLKARVDLMDGVALHGAVPFEKMPGVLQSLDILCYTTEIRNAFQSPIKLYEYMAADKPIVAAETPLVRELLGDNQRGLLYPIGDYSILSQQILKLVGNFASAEVLAKKAFREVRENHSWHNRIIKLLNELKKRGLVEG